MNRPGAPLYGPELLGLAVSLADFPLDSSLLLRGSARSRTCGSSVTLGLALDQRGRVERVGMQVSACAVGQAAAALFAASAPGRDESDISHALAAIRAWLANEGPLPDWPGLSALAPARQHPARHSAMTLPWIAAIGALCNAPATD